MFQNADLSQQLVFSMAKSDSGRPTTPEANDYHLLDRLRSEKHRDSLFNQVPFIRLTLNDETGSEATLVDWYIWKFCIGTGKWSWAVWRTTAEQLLRGVHSLS